MRWLQRGGVAAGVVANAEDLCNTDPHLQSRRYWARVATPEGSEIDLDGVPVKLSMTPGHVSAPGPLLGEHTDVVLQRVLAMHPDSIAELRAADIIA